MAILPGALIVYLGFSGGGFFTGTVSFGAVLVLQMLVLRILLADHPLAGATRPLAVTVGALALFTLWVLASTLWSDSTSRALTEYSRALLYLAVLVVMGLLPRQAWRIGWIVRSTAIGAVIVCTAGLISRVLPEVWPTAEGVANNRLSFPLTYWNALGLLAAIGLVLCVGLATNDRESRAGRALAAAAVPLLAATLFFTFSRGAIATAAIGMIVYLCAARQRAMIAGLLAILPPTVIAVLVAYGADQLATINPTTPVAVEQGRHVAAVLVFCVLGAGLLRLVLAPLDRRMVQIEIRGSTRRTLRLVGAGLVATALLAAVLAGGVGWAGDQYERFAQGATLPAGGDLRQRLTDPSANGRTRHWRVALDGFADDRLHGHGAGSYASLWAQRRDEPATVLDAHGLYFETLAELGVVGLVLLVTAIVSILWAFRRGMRGINRGFYAALLAAGVVWTLHAGIDWDWEMPAVTAWFFAAGGAALAARSNVTSGRRPLGRDRRVPIAIALLVVAITPALLMLSQARLVKSADAFVAGNCRDAERYALSAISMFGSRPQPYQILGYCDLEQSRSRAAVAAMQQAVDHEPDAWEYRFSLAIAQAEAGIDPRPELQRVQRLNPLEPLVRNAAGSLGRSDSPDVWASEGAKLRLATLTSGLLTIK
jgi:O-antigen ligase